MTKLEILLLILLGISWIANFVMLLYVWSDKGEK